LKYRLTDSDCTDDSFWLLVWCVGMNEAGMPVTMRLRR
jgi:hypothetical protein